MTRPACTSLAIFLMSSLLTATATLAQVPDYAVAALGEVAVYPKISASAIVISLEESDLSAQITAQVEQVIADVGSAVKQGDTLIRLDCDDYQLAVRMASADVDAAKANLELVKNQYARASRLLEQNLASEETADTAAANLAAAKARQDRAEAAFDSAKLDKSRCNLSAPYSGTVSQRYASKGQLATVGTALIRLVNHLDLEVSAQVSEQNLNTFSEATAFNFNGLARYPLRLQRSVNALDSSTRTQEIRLTFTGDKPIPGTAGKVSWQSTVPHIGKEYLTQREGITGFFTVDDGTARFVPLGNFFPEKNYPVSLSLDTIIITENLQSLSDGDPIRPRQKPDISVSGAD